MERRHPPSTSVAHASFGDLLRHLRRQAYMTQRDLALATGYSIGQICRFEQNQCVPDLPTLTARFVPALVPASDTSTTERLLALAHTARTAHRGQRRSPPLLLVSKEPGVGHDPALELPLPATPLLGREYDVAQVCTLLQQTTVRLLTLTGAPGIGKTRLGLQVATDLHAAFVDGIVFVPLAPISDPDLVLATIAQVLDVQEQASRALLDSLKGFLREKHLLLLLDNFEQLISAAPLVSELLAAAPGLKVLATSRRPLRLSGEQEFVVAPLALPPRGKTTQASACAAILTQYAAVQLFIVRAQAVKADFAVTDATAAAIAEICHRLDGLPLAIELAAARVKLFPPQALLTRLKRRLQLLTTGAQDLPARQQTLRTTIDWSYQLLGAGEQLLFARLGVFVGGCTLEAVEAISTTADDLRSDVLDGLTALVDQSLLKQIEDVGDEPRFTMLEIIREYASEQLMARGEVEVLQQHHAAYYLALAERAAPKLHGTEQGTWLDRLEIEHDNLRAALEWSNSVAEPTLGVRLATALFELWERRGSVSEGRRWLSELLLRVPERSSIRAAILWRLGNMVLMQHDPTGASSALRESLAIGREMGDEHATMLALCGLGIVALRQHELTQSGEIFTEALSLSRKLGDIHDIAFVLHQSSKLAEALGDFEQAVALVAESLALHRQMGDQLGIAGSLLRLGQIAYAQADITQAQAFLEESLTIQRTLGNNVAILLILLGEVARASGDYQHAAALFEESMGSSRDLDDQVLAALLHNLGHVALHDGDIGRAATLFSESLTLSRKHEDRDGIALCLASLAGVAIVRQRLELAARLFGAADRLLGEMNVNLGLADRIEFDRNLAAVRTQAKEKTFAEAWAEGRAIPIAQAIAYALELTPAMPSLAALHAPIQPI
jgi:predicted ATPase